MRNVHAMYPCPWWWTCSTTTTESKHMQRALRNTLMAGNGEEKLDNELTTTLWKLSRHLRNYTNSRVSKQFVLFRGHQLFVSYTTTAQTHQQYKWVQILRTWWRRQHVYQVLCSRYLLESRTSRSNQVLKPQDSRIHVFHASNTSSMKECVCHTIFYLDFYFRVSQTSKQCHLLQQQCLLDAFRRHHFCFTTAQCHTLTSTESM